MRRIGQAAGTLYPQPVLCFTIPRCQSGFHSLPAAQSFTNKPKLNFLKFSLHSLPLFLHFNGLILEEQEREEGMVFFFFYLVNKLLLLLMDILTVWRTKTGLGGDVHITAQGRRICKLKHEICFAFSLQMIFLNASGRGKKTPSVRRF